MMRPISPLAAFLLLACTAPLAAQEPNFGAALAGGEAELLVGQPVNWYGPGTVYAYRRGAGGAWTEVQRLTAPDTTRKDDFGAALALDGNTLVVGAPRKRDGAGVTYVFTRPSVDAEWAHTATLEAPAGGEFGTALALAGDDLLVGAPEADSTGLVHRFRRRGGAWVAEGAIRPDPDVRQFGAALSRDGAWALIGAPGTDSAGGAAHAVHLRAGRAAGLQRLAAAGGAPRARMGRSVLLAGDRGWVGVPGRGRVLAVARGADGRWAVTDTIASPDTARGTNFGLALARVGEELWVGAPTSTRNNGAVWRLGATGPGTRMVPDSADGTHWPFLFGYAIASAGGDGVVGMPMRDFGEGRALVARRTDTGWAPRQQLTGEIFAIGGAPAPARRCEDGQVGVFTCRGIEVVAHLPASALGGARGAWVNDIWGWTDPVTRRDYALVARRDGVSFVDVTTPSAPRLVGTLDRTAGTPPSVWRDIKVIRDHAVIVADGSGEHGMQVFDLTRLRQATAGPMGFTPDTTYHRIASAHNVVADTASGFVYVVGANGGGETCGGGLHMVDARDPRRPVFAGCYHEPAGASSRGYTHDAQCVTYAGPDARYRGREICVGSNESEINIADVTDKANPVLVGRNSYPDVAYAHQGWFDAEQRYFYMNDELDEIAGKVPGTRTIVWDLAQLDDPVVAHIYIGPVRSSDHNLFVVGDRMYQSNYGSGLRVLDIGDRTAPREIGFIDTAPFNDDGPGTSAQQSGAWSNYPFFESGVVVFTSVREGLFIVRVSPEPPIS